MKKQYQTPKEYFFRCIFPRGRLLSHLEDDLTIFTNILITNASKKEEDFIAAFDEQYGKIIALKKKTIQNHRTEMNKLFGMFFVDENGRVQASPRAISLIQNQDFPMFFKEFCNKFQYPNCINKSHETKMQIKRKIRFRPAQFILQLMKEGNKIFGPTFSITGAEVSNLIFNDTRVTSGIDKPETVLSRLINLRKDKLTFLGGSYYIQHGREFLGYMRLAGLLLKSAGDSFVLNTDEDKSTEYIINNQVLFEFPGRYLASLEARKETQKKWDRWFGDSSAEEREQFATSDKKLKEALVEEILEMGELPAPARNALREVGDAGELIVFKYEKDKISAIRPDKVSLVKIVSNDTILGFDIQSLEFDNINKKKFIEVKTTMRTFPPSEEIFTFFRMSHNEWLSAKQHGGSYYIYRVFMTSEGSRIFIVKNPYQQQKEGKIFIEPLHYRVILKKEAGHFV